MQGRKNYGEKETCGDRTSGRGTSTLAPLLRIVREVVVPPPLLSLRSALQLLSCTLRGRGMRASAEGHAARCAPQRLIELRGGGASLSPSSIGSFS